MTSSLEISFMCLKAGLLSPRLSPYTTYKCHASDSSEAVWEPRLLLPQPLEPYLGRILPHCSELSWVLDSSAPPLSLILFLFIGLIHIP